MNRNLLFFTSTLALTTPAIQSAAHAQSIVISNIKVTVDPVNAGWGIEVVTVTGPLGQARKYVLSLSGPDAAKFRLSSTKMPATLKIGPTSLPAQPNQPYNITIVGISP